MESKRKSVIKAITWQFVHLGFVAGLIYIYTREWEYASLGAVAYLAWESTAYYFHERAWARFGKNVK